METAEESPPPRTKKVAKVLEKLKLSEDKVVELRKQYVVLMETNGEECESWYYLIPLEGNEIALEYLYKQLEEIEMFVIDDLSTFDLDLAHPICERSAKELTKLELNSVSFHRKFEGKLEMINLGLKKKDSHEKRIFRVNKVLARGQIEDYIEGEDLDSEDLESGSDEESDHEEDEDLVPLPLGTKKN